MKLTVRDVVGCLAIALAVTAAASFPAVVQYIDDIHPRTVTRYLKQVEADYRTHPRHNPKMLEYVEQHYRYEDMPEHRDTEAAEALAAQRKRTMEAISAGDAKQP